MRNLWIAVFSSAALLLGFHLWYHAGDGPLSEAEIEVFRGRLAAREGRSTKGLEGALDFMRSDDGRPVVMVNLLRHRERAQFSDGDRGMTGTEADNVYGRAVLPELFRRASHPLIIAHPVTKLGEGEGGPDIDFIAAVRYRSRRDLLEMATSDRWLEISEYKYAGLETEILRPSEARLAVSDLRLILAVAGLTLLAALRLMQKGRRSRLAAGLVAAIVAIFSFWYGSEAPLSEAEVEPLLREFAARQGNGAVGNPEALADLRRFAESDDGAPFYNVNLNRFHESPVYADGRSTELSSRETNALYTRVAGPTVVRGAGHPALMLHPVARLGPDGHEYRWDDINFIRYRSRRQFLTMIASDAWDDVAVHKFAALRSATTYPSLGFQVPDPRLVLLGLSALAVWGVPRRAA